MKKPRVSPRKAPRSAPRRWTIPMVAIAIAGLVIIIAWGTYRFGWLDRLAGKPKLNVLLITLDTTRPDYLGCYGGTAAQTPNLDQLAREGLRFAQCNSCSPLTFPSHTSIMTSLYPYVHRARRNGANYLAADNPTLAETLLAAGYRTQAAIASFVLNRQFGLARGFEIYHDVPPSAGTSPDAERRANVVCDDALGLLRSLAHERFFLWVHFYDPHFPYESTRHPDHASPEAYADEITFMDEHIGRLLTELRTLGLDANTLVVAVGDHGEGLGQHEEQGHGNFLYETTLHVPLILRCPGVAGAGRVIDPPVRTIDIASTILELVGHPEMPDSQGISLCSLLRGEDRLSPPRSYAETFEANIQFGLSPLRSLRRDRWKYILAPQPELYDLAADPAEARNSASDESGAALNLRTELHTLIAEAPPPAKTAPRVGLTSDEVKRLESLGYVGGGGPTSPDVQAELDLFEPRGGNPRDYAPLFELFSRAGENLRRGQPAVAERMFRQVIAALPDAPHPYAGLAEALRAQHRLDQAVEAYQAASARAPKDCTMHQNAGITLAMIGRLDEAEREFQAGLRVEPDNCGLLRSMGSLRVRQQRLPEAAVFLRKAVTANPDDRKAAEELRQVELSLGR
jgi:arylsulfatase A-like enzyme